MKEQTSLSESRKGQILDAATTVFAKKGFHQARMDDIVAQSGLSKGALYWYFKSKDDIIAAILGRFFDQEMADLEALVSRSGPAGERLLQLTALVAAEIQRLSRLLPVTFEFYAVAARQNSVREALKSYFKKYTALLAALIQEGIDQGEFRPMDPVAAAVSVIALYEGLMLLNIVDPESVSWGISSERAIRLLLEGLQAGQVS